MEADKAETSSEAISGRGALRRFGLTTVVIGLVVTIIALLNLWGLELEGCDPGNPPEHCGGAYAVLWAGLGLVITGGTSVLGSMALSSLRDEKNSA